MCMRETSIVVEMCTYIYWTVLGSGQSIEPAIDYRMMDLLYRECLVHHHRYCCILVHDAIQRNVAVLYDHHCQQSIGHSIDRLFPNGLTFFEIKSYLRYWKLCNSFSSLYHFVHSIVAILFYCASIIGMQNLKKNRRKICLL